MSWASERRLDWIDDKLFTDGFINRSDVADFFGVTPQIVSADFTAFCVLDPHLVYDVRRKRYERRGGGSVRGSTPDRRTAWLAFSHAALQHGDSKP